MKSRQSHHAYTLIEILIALFIFSIVAIIVTMALQNIVRTRDTLDDKSQQLAELQKGMTIIARDIEQIINRRVLGSNGLREPAVWGQDEGGLQTLSFTRAGYLNPEANAKRGGLQRVRYRLENNRLHRDFWTDIDSTGETEPASKILLGEINSLQWTFIDSRESRLRYWPATGRASAPPRAIELIVDLQGWGEIRRLLLVPGEEFNEVTAADIKEEKTDDE